MRPEEDQLWAQWYKNNIFQKNDFFVILKVYGCSFWPNKLLEKLSKLGFADSKQLKESERDDLFL